MYVKKASHVTGVLAKHTQLVAALVQRSAVVVDAVDERADRKHVAARVAVVRHDELRCQVVEVGLCDWRRVQTPLWTLVVCLNATVKQSCVSK